jgi:hypothetical protein
MINKLENLGIDMRGTRWRIAIPLIIAIIGAITISFTIAGTIFAQPQSSAARTVKVYIQTTDSCMQALSGATFTVAGPGINTTTAPTSGSRPRGLPGYVHGHCPIDQGTCLNFSTGCTTTLLNVPASGIATYKFTVAKTAPGGYGANLSYAICDNGSDCPHGPEVATVHVRSSGSVSATVLNINPDGTTVTWPTTRSAYSGTQADPVLFHEYGIGNGSLQCDGDHDADDRLTGSPHVAHCDSDHD